MVVTQRPPAKERRREVASALNEPQLRTRVAELLGRHPAVGMAIGVVRDGRLDFFEGHGLADIERRSPMTADTVVRVASITKTFTAVAVMQLWEQGLVDLDAPANLYLRAFQLVPRNPRWQPVTVRHLLTHTSGVPEMVHPSRALRYAFGESYALDETVPSLADYYRRGLPVVTEPGAVFRYTDHNFATLGQVVTDITGQSIQDYLREHVFKPLGMVDTDLLRTARVDARRATGYTLGRSGPKAVVDRQWLTAAASMTYSTPRDMAMYLAALLGGGANDHGRVLKPATLALMFDPQYQTHPLLPGIGLAFDRFEAGGHRIVGHEGVLPGFNSQVFVAPDDGVGVMAFTNGAPGAMLWLPAEASALLGSLIGAPPDVVRTGLPQHPEAWGEICGWYKPSARLLDMRLRAFLGLGAEVFVRRGQLVARLLHPMPALFHGFVLHPDDPADPFVFRIEAKEWGIDSARIVFSRSEAGPMRMHLDLMPLSLEKQPDATNPRILAVRVLRSVAMAAAVRALRRRRRARRERAEPNPG